MRPEEPHVPVPPHIQRVIPVSSSSSSPSAPSPSPEASGFESSPLGISITNPDAFSFSLPFRFVRVLPLPLTPFLCVSSGTSSFSSCLLLRLLLFEPFDEDAGGRCELSFGFEPGSEEGEPAGDLLLVDAVGAVRLPERRGSLGDGGGPILAKFAMVLRKTTGQR